MRIAMLLTGFLIAICPFVANAEAGDVDGLQLLAEASGQSVVSGEPMLLTATFRNAIEDSGESRIHVYVPEHLGIVPFPKWTLEAEDGTTYRPHTPSFQSGWTTGLQGEIMELKTGGERRFSTRVSHVVPADAEPYSGDARALPPGTYNVQCRYAKPDKRVPYGREGFTQERVVHDELWTGAVKARPFTLVVEASERPVLTIDAPKTATPGEPYPIEVELRNLGTKPFDVRGALVLRVGMKARPSGTARFALVGGEIQRAKGDSTHAVHLAPGAAISGRIDLAAIAFENRHKDIVKELGFVDLAHDGTFHLSAAFVDQDGTKIATTGMMRRMRAVDPVVGGPLAVSIERVSAKSMTPVIDVVLTNTGTTAVRVPATLSYPENIYFQITRPESGKRPSHSVTMSGGLEPWRDIPEPGPQALIADGMSWDADAFEARRDWKTASTVLLAPGGEIRRRIQLGELVTPSDPLQWTNTITAYYRNYEPGTRFGLDDMFVGLVRGESIQVKGRGW